MSRKKPPKNIPSKVIETKTKRPVGRPSLYSKELAEEICSRIAAGELAIAICREEGMPEFQTLMNWCIKHTEFFELYARAKKTQADLWAEETIEIADKATDADYAQAQRLKVDTRKWYISKVRPRMWGENGTGLEPGSGSSADADRRLLESLRAYRARRQKKADSTEGEA